MKTLSILALAVLPLACSSAENQDGSGVASIHGSGGVSYNNILEIDGDRSSVVYTIASSIVADYNGKVEGQPSMTSSRAGSSEPLDRVECEVNDDHARCTFVGVSPSSTSTTGSSISNLTSAMTVQRALYTILAKDAAATKEFISARSKVGDISADGVVGDGETRRVKITDGNNEIIGCSERMNPDLELKEIKGCRPTGNLKRNSRGDKSCLLVKGFSPIVDCYYNGVARTTPIPATPVPTPAP